MSTTERPRDSAVETTLASRPTGGGPGDPLPVIYSILSADALLERITNTYSVGRPVSCQLLRPGSNDTYLVTTGEGRFIARVYGEHWRSLSEIHYEVDLLHHLAGRGVSVALPISAADGVVARPIAAPEGTRYLVLFTCAPGKPLQWTQADHCLLAGRMAAALHTASDDFQSSHRRFQLDLEYLVDKPLAALEPFLAHRPSDWRYVEAYAAEVRTRAAAAIKEGLDWGVCHGDLGNQNIYVSDDGLATIIDFDLAGLGWRAYDFVAAKWLSSYDERSHVWEAFVAGYSQTRPLSPADLAAVEIFHGISRLWTVGLDASNARRWGALPMSDYYLDSYLQSLRQWEQEFGEGL